LQQQQTSFAQQHHACLFAWACLLAVTTVNTSLRPNLFTKSDHNPFEKETPEKLDMDDDAHYLNCSQHRSHTQTHTHNMLAHTR
jgi:predicted pyridoxine 5'-phosphate oxidase superfamily flavin-nucleotide-binding protein